MRRSTALAAAASLCLVLGANACGGGQDEESKDDLVADLSEALQGRDDLDQDAADCIAERVVEDIGVDKMREVDVQDDEPPDELQPEIAAATIRANEECLTSSEG